MVMQQIIDAWKRLPDGVQGILFHVIPMLVGIVLVLLLSR